MSNAEGGAGGFALDVGKPPELAETIELSVPPAQAKDEPSKDDDEKPKAIGAKTIDVPGLDDDADKRIDVGQDEVDQRGKDDIDEEGGDDDRERTNLRTARRGERKALQRVDKLEAQLGRVLSTIEHLQEQQTREKLGSIAAQAENARSRYNDARSRIAQATTDNDISALTAAQEDLRLAEGDFNTAKSAYQRVESGSQRNSLAMDAWLDSNPSFRADGQDEYSRRARELSSRLAKEGISTKTSVHFDELDRHLRREFPDKYKGRGRDKADDLDEDGDDAVSRETRRGRAEAEPERKKPANAGGPRGAVGGGRNLNADPANNTKVPRAYLMNAQAMGHDVNDPKVRQRLLTKFNETQGYIRSGGTRNVG